MPQKSKVVSITGHAHIFHGHKSTYAIPWKASNKEKTGEVPFDEMVEQVKRIMQQDGVEPGNLYLVRGHRVGQPHYVYAYKFRGLDDAVLLFSRRIVETLKEMHPKDKDICFLKVVPEKGNSHRPSIVTLNLPTVASAIAAVAMGHQSGTVQIKDSVSEKDARDMFLLESAIFTMCVAGLSDEGCKLLQKKLSLKK
ncbi:MAG: hypothetical protein QG653_81 [Patescibacteria group bacterium]|nr:hypothetical protein [Patescibacteria group bacterium]